MSSFAIVLTDEEINHTALALQRAITGNENKDAVKVFEGIQEKLDPYISDATKQAITVMKIFKI